MGVEHSFKEEERLVCRCPKCEHLSLDYVLDDGPYVSFFAGLSGEYFLCKNPDCDVDRIYGDTAVTLVTNDRTKT